MPIPNSASSITAFNLIEELLQAAAPAETTTLSDLQPTATPSYARTETELRTWRALTASVPTLERPRSSARRDHTVALDERMQEVLATDSESDRGSPFAQASEQTAEPPALEQIDGKVVAATPKDMRHETPAPDAVQVNLRASRRNRPIMATILLHLRHWIQLSPSNDHPYSTLC